ncbi:MAG TPA: hypothetical protein VMT52_11425 [Planctomycetota bacterium]|nr:hypothetical protein [Planctomycetota bacterium]
MSDYKDLVKKEAKAFYEGNRTAFEADTDEFGGKSPGPNLLRWIDRTEKLSKRIDEIAAKWSTKEFHWVQTNTRNKNAQGGDPRSNAFASFLQDVRHEIKKMSKA